jgi:ADP-ribose pyrophosphatase YjhB (NUDIX family)
MDRKQFMRITVKAILLNSQNQVLILNDRNSHYDLPGGGVDEGETLEQACLRELKEETPYEQFKIIEKLPNQYPYYVKNNPDFKSMMHCYVVKLIDDAKVSDLEPDTFEEWVSAGEVLEYFGNRDTPRHQAMKNSISDFNDSL